MENVQVKEGGEQNQPHPKRIKTQEDPEKDRISLLPDGLIIDDILPRLESTKDAIRTGALSRRWQHLWPFVSVLYFSDDDSNSNSNEKWSLSDFYLSVDETLTQCRPHLKKLHKFHASAAYLNRFESQLYNWIRFATDCNVQQLSLDLCNMYFGHQFVFKDDSFFVNSHFTHLHLGGCMFNPTGPIIWNNLTSLSMSNGRLDEHLIANILSGSPLLDTLRLAGCYGYRRLDITSKSVKHLVFFGYSPQEDDIVDGVEINAPYLLSLTIQEELFLTKLSLLDVSSLVKADLDYTKTGYYGTPTAPKGEEEEMLKRLILNLRHVNELKIGIRCYKTLSRLEAKGFIFPLNLKVLDVTLPLHSDTDSTELVDWSDNDSSDGDSSYSDASDGDSSYSDASDNDSVEKGD